MLYLIVAIVAFVTGAGVVSLWTFTVLRRSGELSKREAAARMREEKVRDKEDALHQTTQDVLNRKVSLEEYENENLVLKRDLQNVDVTIRRLEMARAKQDERQNELDERGRKLGRKYLDETVRWVGRSITPNNYTKSKQQLVKAIEWCRSVGLDVSPEDEQQILDDLKEEFEKAVRAQVEREEQARIKAIIREEQAREREAQKLLKAIERERDVIEKAIHEALARAEDEHSDEIEQLKAQLAEVQSRQERAISLAQMTKAGNVYVISNIGSFGEGVFKIGMTRRQDPEDRVRELGDASVPFAFDVHMMISCDDAPALERRLHQHFEHNRINKMNPRKEFFRVSLEEIAAIVEREHGEVAYVADAEALEYRQSLEMSPEDQGVVAAAFRDAEDEIGVQERPE